MTELTLSRSAEPFSRSSSSSQKLFVLHESKKVSAGKVGNKIMSLWESPSRNYGCGVLEKHSMTMRIGWLLVLVIAGSPSASGALDFTRDIRPLLSDRCIKCHGPGEQKAKLRLDTREGALRVIDLEKPAESELLYRLTAADLDDRMTPKEGGTKRLTPAQVELVREWVHAGAPYDRHWAYERPQKAPLPVDRHPVDHFVGKRLVDAGLKPNPPADPAILLRRLSLDLIGLPPTVAEVDAFVSDPSEENYLAQIERLLDSSHFGEKWAVGWLDLARYADSNGYQHDDLRTMRPWRDWVIRALNSDRPYDQFTIEQLAGDLLPNPTQDQLIATAFHRNTPSNFSGGSKVDEVRASLLMDRAALPAKSGWGPPWSARPATATSSIPSRIVTTTRCMRSSTALFLKSREWLRTWLARSSLARPSRCRPAGRIRNRPLN